MLGIYTMDFYIVPNGIGSGSIDSPCGLSNFLSRARPGDKGILRGGIYREEIILPRSGTSSNPISLVAHPGENPIVSGCNVVSGGWQLVNGLFTVQVPSSWNLGIGNTQVFGDSVPMTEARWPVIDSYKKAIDRENFAISSMGALTSTTPDSNGLYSASFSHPDLASFAPGFWDGALIGLIPGKEWSGYQGVVASHSGNTINFKFPYPANGHNPSAAAPIADNPFYLFGREYFPSDAENTFFLGADNILKIKRQQLPTTVEIKVRDIILDGNDCSHWIFDGIAFIAGRVMWRNSCENLIINNCSFFYPTASCRTGTPAGIVFRGTSHKMINSRLEYATGNGMELRGTLHLIENCVFGYCAIQPIGSHAITEVDCSDSRVRRNTIYASSAYGLEGRITKGIFELNRIGWFGLSKSDIAAITTWNGGDMQKAEVRYNFCHDGYAVFKDSRNGAMGIRCDSGGGAGVANMVIHHNVIWNISNRNAALSVWGLLPTQVGGVPNIEVYNNSCREGITLAGDSTERGFQGIKIKNNFAMQFRTFNGTLIPAGAEVTSNIFPYAYPGNFFLEDPGVNLGNMSLELELGKDVGEIIPPYTNGFTGSLPDIGAYENPFRPGAIALNFSELTFRQDIKPTRFLVENLPTGRGLPHDFVLKIGAAQVNTHQEVLSRDGGMIAIFNFPEGSKAEGVLQYGVTGIPLSSSGLTFSLQPIVSSVTYSDSNNSIAVKGTGIDTKTYTSIPYQLKLRDWLNLLETRRPLLVKVPESHLVGFAKPDLSNLRFIDWENRFLPYWIDTASGGFVWAWVQIDKDSKYYRLPTEEDVYPITCVAGDASWVTSASTVAGVLPQLDLGSLVFWLRSHSLVAVDTATIDSVANFGKTGGRFVASASTRPSFVRRSLGGLPAISFDGIDDFLAYQGASPQPGMATILLVYRNPEPGATRFQRFTSSYSPGGVDTSTGLYTTPPPAGSAPTPYPSGASLLSLYSASRSFENFRLGSRSDRAGGFYKGEISEVLVYSELLTPAARNSVRDYLAIKYGIDGGVGIPIEIAESAISKPIVISIDGKNYTPSASTSGEVVFSGVNLPTGSYSIAVSGGGISGGTATYPLSAASATSGDTYGVIL